IISESARALIKSGDIKNPFADVASHSHDTIPTDVIRISINRLRLIRGQSSLGNIELIAPRITVLLNSSCFPGRPRSGFFPLGFSWQTLADSLGASIRFLPAQSENWGDRVVIVGQ